MSTESSAVVGFTDDVSTVDVAGVELCCCDVVED
jgi:hypothetical protein